MKWKSGMKQLHGCFYLYIEVSLVLSHLRDATGALAVSSVSQPQWY